MLEQLSQEKIKENWKRYKSDLEIAFTSSEGANIVTGDGSQNIYKVIYNSLINPSDPDMHLWIDDDNDYLLLTQLQICEYTDKKTLVLFALTRTKDVDSETILKRWLDGFPIITSHARNHNCEGIFGYTDLEYFIKIVKQIAEATKQKIVTRYQFIFPL
jgi:hypothetical protein